MKYIYPAIFKPLENEIYFVKVPDLPGCMTEGKNLQDAYDMVQDAIAMWICDSEDNQEIIQAPTDIHKVEYHDPEFVSLVSVDTKAYRMSIDNRAVKKTLTIPSWLNYKAEEEGINFSQVLQTALKQQLNITTR